eukprot:scaffold45234_cov72-Phaeocystis_antarctica.AAC.1
MDQRAAATATPRLHPRCRRTGRLARRSPAPGRRRARACAAAASQWRGATRSSARRTTGSSPAWLTSAARRSTRSVPSGASARVRTSSRPPRRRAGLTQPSATPGAAFGRHEHAWPASLAGPCLRIWRTAAAQSVGSRTASERKPAADSRYASASAGTETRPVSSRSSINSGRIPCRLSARFRRERRASCGCGGGGRTGRYGPRQRWHTLLTAMAHLTRPFQVSRCFPLLLPHALLYSLTLPPGQPFRGGRPAGLERQQPQAPVSRCGPKDALPVRTWL